MRRHRLAGLRGMGAKRMGGGKHQEQFIMKDIAHIARNRDKRGYYANGLRDNSIGLVSKVSYRSTIGKIDSGSNQLVRKEAFVARCEMF